jgi:hypothetical protein
MRNELFNDPKDLRVRSLIFFYVIYILALLDYLEENFKAALDLQYMES